MADGELGAVFRALAKDAAQAAEHASESIAKVTEQTANIEERNVSEILEADAKAADRIGAAGKKGTPETAGAGTRPVPAGPPWPVAGRGLSSGQDSQPAERAPHRGRRAAAWWAGRTASFCAATRTRCGTM
jgi:hypothetical protein